MKDVLTIAIDSEDFEDAFSVVPSSLLFPPNEYMEIAATNIIEIRIIFFLIEISRLASKRFYLTETDMPNKASLNTVI